MTQEEQIHNLRNQIAMAVSGYIDSSEITRKLLSAVKEALSGGLTHQRSRLELAVSRFTNEFNQLSLANPPSIKTDVRMFDLVRYMRAELHEANLITNEEYAWLCSHNPSEPTKDGSPSRLRLESYDELRAKLDLLEKQQKQP